MWTKIFQPERQPKEDIVDFVSRTNLGKSSSHDLFGPIAVTWWRGIFEGELLRVFVRPSYKSHSPPAVEQSTAGVNNWIDIVVLKGDLSDRQLHRLAKLAETSDRRPARARLIGRLSPYNDSQPGFEVPTLWERVGSLPNSNIPIFEAPFYDDQPIDADLERRSE